MTREEMETRVAELNRQIQAAPGWGAAVGAMVEERNGLERKLAAPNRLRTGHVPFSIEEDAARLMIYGLISLERDRQQKLFGDTNRMEIGTNPEKLAILMEEAGEAAKEVVEHMIAVDLKEEKEAHERLRTELVQVGACVVAWLETL